MLSRRPTYRLWPLPSALNRLSSAQSRPAGGFLAQHRSRRFYASQQQPNPLPDAIEADEEPTDERKKDDVHWRSTLFKMFESAMTTFASITILGWVLSCVHLELCISILLIVPTPHAQLNRVNLVLTYIC